tara:strand:+ start:234 stop:440 length:207 start_codon:yes stop_codon:yes gene_type:complete
MTTKEINKLKKGDKIKIHTFHYREGRIKTTRLVSDILENTISGENKIYVRCFGWDNFLLRSNEIIEKL